MLLVRRIALLLAAVLAVSAVLLIGIRSHALLARGALDAEEARFLGESQLFGSIVAAGAVALAAAGILLRSVAVSRRLRRLAELSRLGSASLEEGLGRLGDLGAQIRQIVANVTDLNRRSLLKVSALGNLAEFLLANSAMRLLVVDAAGKVVGASRGYRTEDGAGGPPPVGRHVGELLEGMSFPAVYGRLERERAVIADAERPGLRFVPVVNRDGELDAVLCVLGKVDLATPSTAGEPAPARVRSLLGRFLRRRQR